MAAKVGVLSCPLMVRENSSVPLLMVPGSPFPQEHPERRWVRKACLGPYPLCEGRSPGMVLGPVLQPPGRRFSSLRTKLNHLV